MSLISPMQRAAGVDALLAARRPARPEDTGRPTDDAGVVTPEDIAAPTARHGVREPGDGGTDGRHGRGGLRFDALAGTDGEARDRWLGSTGEGTDTDATPAPPARARTSLEDVEVLLGGDIDPSNPSLVIGELSVSTGIARVLGEPGSRELAASIADPKIELLTSGSTDDPRATHAHVDLGGDRQLLILADDDGKQEGFVLGEGGEITRLRDDERVELGVGRWATQSGDGTVRFGIRSLQTVTLSEDLSTARVTELERGGHWLRPFRHDRRQFGVESGELIVDNGRPLLENMSTRQQFDFHALTPEGRQLLAIEGDPYGTDDARRAVFVARVRYLREEGGPELFDRFTPRRASLSGEELAAYDAEVERVTDHLREIGINTKRSEGIGALDESMLYMLASAVVESYGATPERIDSIVSGVDTRWIVSIDNDDSVPTGTGDTFGVSGGWYDGTNSILQLSLASFVRGYSRSDTGSDLVTHELAHSLDFQDGSDGIPAGMSATDAAVVIRERDRLFSLAYPGRELDLATNQDTTRVVDDSGLGSYAFTNRLEFWADVSGQFLSSDAGAARLRETSPEIYNVLRDYFGRDDLPLATEDSRLPDIGKPGTFGGL